MMSGKIGHINSEGEFVPRPEPCSVCSEYAHTETNEERRERLEATRFSRCIIPDSLKLSECQELQDQPETCGRGVQGEEMSKKFDIGLMIESLTDSVEEAATESWHCRFPSPLVVRLQDEIITAYETMEAELERLRWHYPPDAPLEDTNVFVKFGKEKRVMLAKYTTEHNEFRKGRMVLGHVICWRYV